MAKRKRDDNAGALGHKKSRALLSLRALRQAVGFTPGLGHPLSLQDVRPTPVVVEAPASTVVATVTPAPPPPLVVPVQEVTLVAGVDVLATLAGSIMTSSSIIATLLLSANVVTTSAPMM